MMLARGAMRRLGVHLVRLGGTSVRAAFAVLRAHRLFAVAVVVFTDGRWSRDFGDCGNCKRREITVFGVCVCVGCVVIVLVGFELGWILADRQMDRIDRWIGKKARQL